MLWLPGSAEMPDAWAAGCHRRARHTSRFLHAAPSSFLMMICGTGMVPPARRPAEPSSRLEARSQGEIGVDDDQIGYGTALSVPADEDCLLPWFQGAALQRPIAHVGDLARHLDRHLAAVLCLYPERVEGG